VRLAESEFAGNVEENMLFNRIQDEPAGTITADSRHQPELDGVRGLAILGVLLSHGFHFLGVVPRTPAGDALATIFVPGWGGVDLFFTLSGFLITGILLRARSREKYFLPFYMRRVLRIFPIYYLFLTLTLLVANATKSQTLATFAPKGFQNWAPYFFYLQNWPVFWQNWGAMGTLWGAYWSLAVEEQFYLVWPAVVRFVDLRYIFIFCIGGFLLGWPERAYMIRHIGLNFGIMQWPFSRLDGLFVGAYIAIYREIYGRPVPLRWAVTTFVAGAGLFLWITAVNTEEIRSGNGVHIWRTGVTAFALMSGGLIAATQHHVAWLRRILTIRPLLVAGRLSYGMYVYHLLVYAIFGWLRSHFTDRPASNIVVAILYIALAILLVTGVAELSYRFIEAPFLRLKRFFPAPPAPVS
jgi:peptidoglycan/LPS O-acetylase OafA/YrhL